MVPSTNTAPTMRCWCSPATSPPPRRGRWSRNISAASRAARSTRPAAADVPTLPAPKSIVMKDRVAATQHSARLGGAGPASTAAGRARHRRLDPRRARQLAARQCPGARREDRGRGQRRRAAVPARRHVSACRRRSSRASTRRWSSKRLDEIMADYHRQGADRRTKCSAPRRSEVAGRIRGLEQVGGFGGKAVALAEGQVCSPATSDFYKTTLEPYAAVTPADDARGDAAMADAGRRSTVRLEPGERPPYVEAKAAAAKARQGRRHRDRAKTARPMPPRRPARRRSTSRRSSHVRLSNGIAVDYAQRSAVPVTQIALSFDAGYCGRPARPARACRT